MTEEAARQHTQATELGQRCPALPLISGVAGCSPRTSRTSTRSRTRRWYTKKELYQVGTSQDSQAVQSRWEGHIENAEQWSWKWDLKPKKLCEGNDSRCSGGKTSQQCKNFTIKEDCAQSAAQVADGFAGADIFTMFLLQNDRDQQPTEERRIVSMNGLRNESEDIAPSFVDWPVQVSSLQRDVSSVTKTFFFERRQKTREGNSQLHAFLSDLCAVFGCVFD